MTTPSAPQPQQFVPLTELKLTPEIRDAVNNALSNRTPIMVAYVDEEGQPSLSFRGSTQVYSDTQLAIWVRNPEGGLQKALAQNNRITLFYRDPEKRITLQFRGRARIENDAQDISGGFDPGLDGRIVEALASQQLGEQLGVGARPPIDLRGIRRPPAILFER